MPPLAHGLSAHWCWQLSMFSPERTSRTSESCLPLMTAFWMHPLNISADCTFWWMSRRLGTPPTYRFSGSESCVKAPSDMPMVVCWSSTCRTPSRPVRTAYTVCHSCSLIVFGLLCLGICKLCDHLKKMCIVVPDNSSTRAQVKTKLHIAVNQV